VEESPGLHFSSLPFFGGAELGFGSDDRRLREGTASHAICKQPQRKQRPKATTGNVETWGES